MHFHYTKIDTLPPLAWLAEINDGEVNIIHGSHVETFDKWFVEGAWGGDFLCSSWFCGTGGVVNENHVIFSTPTHVTNGLFIAKDSWGIGYPIVCTF